ncbi:MAG TPA: type II toxin-antitoxin system VapC family toxin [Gemmataceae bacterium]|nr:type II toxin-antitoxin system VapC family toxin [Gemmataceae bacterium]
MTYLLDSNVWVALLRGKKPLVSARFQAAPTADLRVCSVVVAELRYGCALSAKPAANRAAVDALLAPYPSLPFDDAAVDHFVAIRRHLEQLGQVISAYDLQIAAIALADGCTLVTHNTGEFSRVPGLRLQDWEVP